MKHLIATLSPLIIALTVTGWAGCTDWPTRGDSGVCYPEEHLDDDMNCACQGPCFEGWGCEDGTCICIPNCVDLACGDDGCGGSCGGCGSEDSCLQGACVPACGDSFCDPQTEDSCSCPADCGASCGDGCCTSLESPCDCPEDCGDPCEDRTCGSDGCGGSCGDCAAGMVCLSDGSACAEDCDDACVQGETGCDGGQVQHCESYEGPNDTTCWAFGVSEPCPEFQACDPLVGDCVCLYEECSGVCCPTADHKCHNDQCCDPDCGDNVCGEVCGLSCGTCTAEKCTDCEGVCVCDIGQCVCQVTCEEDCEEGETLCGDELLWSCVNVATEDQPCWHWGDEAGCGPNQVCPEGGDACVCQYTDCEGTCCESNDHVCFPANECCEPDCDGKACGDNGCEGSCGTCPGEQVCNDQGQCEDAPCDPDCDGKVCGDDGCEGSCGTCEQGTTCNEDTGLCVLDCQSDCEPGMTSCKAGVLFSCENNADADDPPCWKWSDGGAECEENMICVDGDSQCSCEFESCADACCADGETCVEDACTP